MSVKYFKSIFLLLSLLLIAQNNFAQQEKEQLKLTGNLSYDAGIVTKDYRSLKFNISTPESEKKSALLAGVMSLVVPGAGEIYAGSYLKAGIFLAVEGAVITTAIIYNNKGNKKTDEFQKYADANWSVVRYAEWINTFRDGHITIDPNTNLSPWQRVNWGELNSFEDLAGIGFTHHLPVHGEQQYYELIGKYPQYSGGWDDFTGGPEYHDASPNALGYDQMRGKANDLYNVAAKAVIVIYVNHFLSAFDAIWTTVSYNKSVALNMRVDTMNLAGNRVEFIPTLNLEVGF